RAGAARSARRALLDLLPDRRGRLAVDRHAVILLEASDRGLCLRAEASVRRSGVVAEPLQSRLNIAYRTLVIGRTTLASAPGIAPHGLAQVHLTRISNRARGGTHGAADQCAGARADSGDGSNDRAGAGADAGTTHCAILSRVSACGQQERQ